MSDQKSHQFRPPLYHRNGGERHGSPKPAGSSKESKDQQGWEAYRKWLTRVSKPPVADRAPVDHSIYSWKGYQNWADKVRQSWKPDES